MLSIDDAEALDAWSLAARETSHVPASLRPRAQQLEALAALVTGPHAAAPAGLLDRTLAHVQAHADASAHAMRIESRPAGGAPRLRWADLVSVAALIAIGSAVVMPMLSAARESGRRAVCKANLGQTAVAMTTYASANRDALPMAVAGLGGASWWDVNPSESHSNSSNLYTLAREGLVPLARLSCPGNPVAPVTQTTPGAHDWRRLEEVSYSYQIMFGKNRPTWNSPTRMVVLADRSPVILAAVRHELVDPCSNAPNHEYRGQHLLWTDGSVQWATSPVLESGDNIWLPRPFERILDSLAGKPVPLEGNETPAAADDVFLGP